MNSIDSFWQWFIQHQDLVVNLPLNRAAIYPELMTALHRVDPGLVCDVEINAGGLRHRLVISPEGKKSLFALTMRLVGQAPTSKLKRWQILAFRQPRKGHFALDFGHFRLATDDVLVIVNQNKQTQKIDLSLLSRLFNQGNDMMNTAVMLMLDQLLGEYLVETRLGRLKLVPWTDNTDTRNFVPIVRLPDIVKTMVGPN